MKIEEIMICDLVLNSINVRKTQINEIEQLSKSITENGLINPITVKLIDDEKDKNYKKYEIIAGKRRFLAMKELNKKTIPCNIINIDNMTAKEMSLIENLQKNNLSNCDKILSIAKLYENETDYDKIKTLTKISKSMIKKYIQLKKLPFEVLQKLDEKGKNKITIPIAIQLSNIEVEIDHLDLLDKLQNLKSKTKVEIIKQFIMMNTDDIDELDDLISEYEDNEEGKEKYKKPYVFDSKEQKNLIIPEDLYEDIVELIKSSKSS